MMNLLLSIAYDGRKYHGWQVQPNAPTVQGEVATRLSELFKTDVPVQGCSRTDAGVHALDQKVTVRPPDDAPQIPAENIRRALNGSLPQDIRVITATDMPEDFRSRDNVGKTYTYVLHPGRVTSPFLYGYCWEINPPMDIELMKGAAADLLGTHDFTPFGVNSDVERDPNKTMHRFEIEPDDGLLRISVTGDAFLYKMVRRLVGYLVAVGTERLPPNITAQAFEDPDSFPPFDTAPSQGLFLEKVFYDADEMTSYRCTKLPFLQLK
jgi:tRNA pseudouridine38-40 synthase